MNRSISSSPLWWLTALLVVFSVFPAFAQQPSPVYTPPSARDVLSGKAPLRVLIVTAQPMIAWKGTCDVRVTSMTDSSLLYTSPAAELVGVVSVPEDHSVSLRKAGANFCPVSGAFKLESDQPIALWTSKPDHWTTYSSPLIVTSLADGTFTITREMLLDEYLRNVVPAEMPASFHPQALSAQAIIARTYALKQLGRHAAEGADICATVHCQAFTTDAKRTTATDTAVTATKGLVLLYGGKLADAFYHSCCGGTVDDAGYVWGPEYARPYLSGGYDSTKKLQQDQVGIADILAQGDTYCKRSGNMHWTRKFSPSDVDELVRKNLAKVTGDSAEKITHVTNMAIEDRSPFGRVASLRVEGDGASVLVSGDKVRWLFGSGAPGLDGLWSTLFDLTVTRDDAGNITEYTITGAGRGHGLGLCQWGADGRARAGQTFRDILAAYYPGTRISDTFK
ncbi:MAG TPA: SpoIID/LytB domain-containing protein [Armatimonadota bacterium]|nr:SpoIID/LytB domain-containing protein [Armatimonadota bacterium]